MQGISTMNRFMHQPDRQLDLVLERTIDIPPETVWAAWTTPEHLKHWFTPAPWQTVDCEIDLRPGGIFRTTMRSPEGEEFPNFGCYLEVIPNEQLIWTNALQPGYRPAQAQPIDAHGAFAVTAMISIEPDGSGTKYTAMVIHSDAESCRRHNAVGFQDGWGKALDQLVAYMQNI
jgi:uncharacterized protein YndB with AHSA1/START domain